MSTSTKASTGLERSQVQLPAGPVSYREGGTGDPILFVHGLLVNGSLWDGPAAALADGFRCIVPDWPMGSHTLPMNPEADLSPPGQAEVIASFLDALGIERATIVGNDTGGAVCQIFTAKHPDRVERLVLTNCDTMEHFPPFPFSAMPVIARLPGGMKALSLPFRIGPVGRATYAALAKHRIDPGLVEAWLTPSRRDAAVMRDGGKLTAGMDKRQTIEAAEALKGFERPVLFAWGTADRFFKLDHAERLAAMIPDARIERIEDAGTFVALDQPQQLAKVIRQFATVA